MYAIRSYYAWDEAKKIVLDAYREFSPEMSEIAQKFFDNNWIDGGPRKGKESGAYAMSCNPKSHPYVMLNFQGVITSYSIHYTKLYESSTSSSSSGSVETGESRITSYNVCYTKLLRESVAVFSGTVS